MKEKCYIYTPAPRLSDKVKAAAVCENADPFLDLTTHGKSSELNLEEDAGIRSLACYWEKKCEGDFRFLRSRSFIGTE